MRVMPLLALLAFAAASAACVATDPYQRLARDLTSPLGSQRRRIAVLPFAGLDPALNAEGEAISDRLVSHLYKRGNVELVERTRLHEVSSEASLAQLGAIDEKTGVTLGRLLGAQAIVVGSVARRANGLVLSARVVEVESGMLLAAGSADLPAPQNVTPPPAAPPPPPPPPAPTPAPFGSDQVWRPGADLGSVAKAPWPIEVHGAVASGRRLYIVGGTSHRVTAPGRGDAAVFSARVGREGLEGRWRAERELPEGRYQVGTAAWGRWLFAVGGYHGSTRNEIFASYVGEDGVLGGWTLAGRLPIDCTNPGVLIVGGRLHVAGCASSGGYVHALFSGTLGSAGTVTDWVRTPLPPDSGASCSLASDGASLILAGGAVEDGRFSSSVYTLSLASLGDARSVRKAGALSKGLISAPMGLVGGRLWVVGGLERPDGGGGVVRSRDFAESASWQASSRLGPWSRSAHRLSPPASNLYAPYVDGAFYLVGGEGLGGSSDAVLRLPAP